MNVSYGNSSRKLNLFGCIVAFPLIGLLFLFLAILYLLTYVFGSDSNG